VITGTSQNWEILHGMEHCISKLDHQLGPILHEIPTLAKKECLIAKIFLFSVLGYACQIGQASNHRYGINQAIGSK